MTNYEEINVWRVWVCDRQELIRFRCWSALIIGLWFCQATVCVLCALVRL